jgi:tol-pal system protein YbgF
MRSINGYLAVALLLMLSGCANTDVIIKKQTETDSRLEQLVQGNAALNARVAELSRELNDLQAMTKSNRADLDELKSAVTRVRGDVEAISSRTVSGSPSKPVPHIEVVNRETVPANRDASVQDAYMKAFGLFSANNYKEAINAFSSFIKRYPRSEYAGNAQYWIGECYYSQQDFPRAVTAFNRVLTEYPKGNKAPDALLKIGFSYISMDDQPKAKVALQNLIDKYPNSQAAVKARERLSQY